MTQTIPFIKPKFPPPAELAEDLRRIYENNYYTNNGPMYFKFKREVEEYLGQNIKTVVVSNATQGIMMAIRAATDHTDHQKKYIAVPSFTFAAGPLAIKWCGFEPLFFDVDATTIQPDLKSFEMLAAEYGDRLAGVLLTNSFGIGNTEIGDWETAAAAHGLACIIDSAPGFGSEYADGNLIGARGTCEVFSLHATKPFGIGEGGLITTRDGALADKLESMKNFGFNDQKQTDVLGMNAKITEFDCAIGSRLLQKYPETLAGRRATYHSFESNLSGYGIDFLPRADTAAIQFVTILAEAQKRAGILAALKAGGVEARTYYAPAVHTFPLFADCPTVNLDNTKTVSSRIISLPLHPDMEAATVDYICEIITTELGS